MRIKTPFSDENVAVLCKHNGKSLGTSIHIYWQKFCLGSVFMKAVLRFLESRFHLGSIQSYIQTSPFIMELAGRAGSVWSLTSLCLIRI